MVLTSVSRQALVLISMAATLYLASSSQFRGATISWRPVDSVNFDGRVSTQSSLYYICLERAVSIAT